MQNTTDMEESSMNWKTIAGNRVRHIWKDSTGKECGVGPDFYEDAGIPIDDNGDDMEYVRTEILEEIK